MRKFANGLATMDANGEVAEMLQISGVRGKGKGELASTLPKPFGLLQKTSAVCPLAGVVFVWPEVSIHPKYILPRSCLILSAGATFPYRQP